MASHAVLLNQREPATLNDYRAGVGWRTRDLQPVRQRVGKVIDERRIADGRH